MLSTTDILKDQQETIQKMLDDKECPDSGTIDQYQIFKNAELTPEQHELAEYICAILYRLVSENKKLSDLNVADNIKVFLSAAENAAIDSYGNPYKLIFGPKLFSKFEDLKKYKNTKKRGLYDELKDKELTEDHIAAVIAHELGHVLMKVKHPGVEYKKNEEGADIYGLEILKGAGYCPAAESEVFTYFDLIENEVPLGLDIYVAATDEHMLNRNRKIIADGYLLSKRKKTGEKWSEIPAVAIPKYAHYFERANTLEKEKKEKEKEKRKYPPSVHVYPFYEDLLEDLQNDFSPENLNLLLSERMYSRTMGKILVFQYSRYRKRIIKDLLTKCPYKKIYEDNPNVDQKLLANARTFIDLISKRDKDFKFPKNYYYDAKERAISIKKARIVKGDGKDKEIENVEAAEIYHWYYQTVRCTLELLHSTDILIDENFYADLPTEEMITFRKYISDSLGSLDHKRQYVRNFLDALILKKILSEKNDEEKLSLLLPLLESDRCFQEYETRQIYVKEVANLLSKKYGIDDGTPAYQERIEKEVLTPYFVSKDVISTLGNRYSDKTVSTSLVKSIFENLSQQLVLKRNLSFRMEEIIKHNSEIALLISSKDVLGLNEKFKQGVFESTLAILQNDPAGKDAIIDFLSHDLDMSYVYDYVQDAVLERVEEKIKKHEGEWYRLYDDIKGEYQGITNSYSDGSKLFEKSIDLLSQFHTMFWNNDIDARAAVLRSLLADDEQPFEELFSHVVEKIIPPGTENRQFLIDVIAAFACTYEKSEQPYLISALIAAQRRQKSSGLSVGEALKDFLENLGPAGIKLGQALGSSPDVPEDIRKVMQTMKHSAATPVSWELYHLYDASVPKDKQKKLEKVIGCGSYCIATKSDDGKSVYSLLREYAKARADDVFGQMLKMCGILERKGDKKYTNFAKIFKGIVQKASDMSDIETDFDVGKRQDIMARQIYHNADGTGKVLSLDDSMEATLHVAEWISHGASYKETEMVEGVHYNDFPDGKFKHHFAKAYLELELTNILGGNCFDHDRHGAQMKVKQIDATHFNVGLFDNGAMSDWPPTAKEQEQLGRVLNNIFEELPDVNSTADKLRYLTNGKKGFAGIFNDAIQKEGKEGKASDYLLAVQRGVLALNDYMRHLSQGEVLSVILTSINNVKKMEGQRTAKEKEEAPDSKIISAITEKNIKKLENLAAYLSKNEKKKDWKQAEVKQKDKKEEITSIEKLDMVMTRVKKNAHPAAVVFTPSRDVNTLGKKLGLGITGRSRLAKMTNWITGQRAKYRINGPLAKAFDFGIIAFFGAIGSLAATIQLGAPFAATFFTFLGLSTLFKSGIAVSDIFKGKRSNAAHTIFSLAHKVRELNNEMKKAASSSKEKLRTVLSTLTFSNAVSKPSEKPLYMKPNKEQKKVDPDLTLQAANQHKSKCA